MDQTVYRWATILFRELMHPTAHIAAFDELSGWLAKFRDLPVADRIFALASKRKTDPATDAAPRGRWPWGTGHRSPTRSFRKKPVAAARRSSLATPSAPWPSRPPRATGDSDRRLSRLSPEGL